ncbi:uncharacterized protein BO80DRAFT_195504 [Aspergillus ibericus CBS 121593]|uniref:Uncharacterized protein n=1 Tax=Aspergillus ibericus CBS 121593 TaxID=1448316 RepID=A0A395GNY2_9EURO|nr:hypothetical protein BO80DRAFT_195504 [Aspergillus ibericus CBS 121593]RAK97220.1 hypothetical protein BO80DRAFT_195504 [Aspergillus ibericus CBS 121593]
MVLRDRGKLSKCKSSTTLTLNAKTPARETKPRTLDDQIPFQHSKRESFDANPFHLGSAAYPEVWNLSMRRYVRDVLVSQWSVLYIHYVFMMKIVPSSDRYVGDVVRWARKGRDIITVAEFAHSRLCHLWQPLGTSSSCVDRVDDQSAMRENNH